MRHRLRMRWTLAGLMLAAAVLSNAAPPISGAAPLDAHVDRPLQVLAQQHPEQRVRVIVQAPRAADADVALGQSGGVVRGYLPHVAGVAAELPAGRVRELAKRRGIVRVLLDPPMNPASEMPVGGSQPVSVYPQTVGAPGLWYSGVTGRGVTLAVLDSGVQAHPDLGTPSRVILNRRFNAAASSSADQYGHGTWVAGIAAGNGVASTGRYRGIAPGASVVNLKVSDDIGRAYASDVLQALSWVVSNAATYHIRVLNLSLVSSVPESYTTNLLDAGVEIAWHAGVVVVVAAGNNGVNTVRYAPANDPYVITVGASDDRGTPSPLDDSLAWFSSFGITQDGHSKPDIVAPGRHIIGALASTGSGLAMQFPSKIIDQRYVQLSGTSAAAPVVSGAVALLLQTRPWLTPDQVKWLLTHTARSMATGTGAGGGELDLLAAMRFASQPQRANLGLTPNWLVGQAYLSQRGTPTVSWDSVSWDSVSWDSVSWDSVSWDSVSWDSVSWDSVSWDSVLGAD